MLGLDVLLLRDLHATLPPKLPQCSFECSAILFSRTRLHSNFVLMASNWLLILFNSIFNYFNTSLSFLVTNVERYIEDILLCATPNLVHLSRLCFRADECFQLFSIRMSPH